jgi:hypothetical protein
MRPLVFSFVAAMAIAVVPEIASAQTSLQSLRNQLSGTSLQTYLGTTTFEPDGTMHHTDGSRATWRVVKVGGKNCVEMRYTDARYAGKKRTECIKIVNGTAHMITAYGKHPGAYNVGTVSRSQR